MSAGVESFREHINILCIEQVYSCLLRCHLHIRLWWCQSHVKGHSSHALLHGLDGGHSGEVTGEVCRVDGSCEETVDVARKRMVSISLSIPNLVGDKGSKELDVTHDPRKII